MCRRNDVTRTRCTKTSRIAHVSQQTFQHQVHIVFARCVQVARIYGSNPCVFPSPSNAVFSLEDEIEAFVQKCGSRRMNGLSVGDTVALQNSVCVVLKVVEQAGTHCLWKVAVPSAVVYVGTNLPYAKIVPIKNALQKRVEIGDILESKTINKKWYFKACIRSEKLIEAAGA